MAKPSTDQSIDLLIQQKHKAEQLLSDRPIYDHKFKAWYNTTRQFLIKIFGEQSGNVEELFDGNVLISQSEKDYEETIADALRGNLELLDSALDQLHADRNLEMINSQQNTSLQTASLPPVIFIGHGRSKLWARLQVFLQNELHLKTISYESKSRVGESIISILEQMLSEATFAVLILTAEDETAKKQFRARQNVVHEAGLFQGRLGFKKAVLLVQDKVENFSNVEGLQYIPFTGGQIEQTFHELERWLKDQGQIK